MAVPAGGGDAFSDTLGDRGRCLPVEGEAERFITAFDTFDWRFFRKGLLVLEEGTLRRYYSYREERAEPSSEEIAAIAGIRGQLEVSSWRVNAGGCRLLDDEEKLIGRGDLYGHPRGGSFFGVRVEPLRGYQKECEKLSRRVAASGGISGPTAFYGALLSFGGRKAGEYSQSVNLFLEPDLALPAAFGELFSYFLTILQENRPGILLRLDTEFLHDYRVALRRLRAVTSHMKKEMPPELYATLTEELKSLFAATGRARDLDVLALRREEYGDLLPRQLRPGLHTFFDHVEEERTEAYREIQRLLSSEAYDERISRLWLSVESARGAPWKGTLLLREAVGRWVKKRRAPIVRVLGDKRFLESGSELHRLRIECKKLRYLLEVFGSLYPEVKLAGVLRELKRFQDTLGASHDAAVQRSFLSGMLEEWGSGNHAVAGAIGGLLTELSRQYTEEDKKISKAADRLRGRLRSLQ